ncbi:MAG: hypothetical protein GWP08_20090 [Nitrospiraceae bacterium]|nr:hypothetical protein [Nitrospiraceae bacterium]
MKLTREHILLIVVLLVIVGIVGAVYKLYYVKRMDEFTKNLDTLKQMESTLNDLEETFENTKPQVLIDAHLDRVESLSLDVVKRARFFSTGDMLKIEPIPEGKMLRFYYKDELTKIIQELRQEAYGRSPFCPYPDGTFGAPYPEDLAGMTVTKKIVRKGLRRATFGRSMTRMLMKAKAKRIDSVVIWPARNSPDNLLVYRTVGLGFLMDLKDLVKFLDDLRLDNRYHSVDALSIQNPYLRYPSQPPVEVRILLTLADYIKPENRKAGGGRATPAGGPQGPMMAFGRPGMSPDEIRASLSGLGGGRNRRRNEPEPTKWQRFARWFKKYFWPF